MPLPAAQLAADSPARSRRPSRGRVLSPQPTAPPVVRYPSAAGNPPRPWAAAVPWPGAWALVDGKTLAKCVPPASDSGEISPRCVFGLWPWQYFAAVRFRGGSSRGEIMPWCVSGRRSVAAFSLHAFPKGPRTGKAPLPGNISPPCIQNELASARFARHASEKPRKRAFGDAPREDLAMKGPLSLRGPLRSCTARRPCRRSALAGCWALCVKGLGPGRVTALRIVADGPARRHGISLRSAAAAYPAAERLALRRAALAVTIPRRDRPRPAADAPPSFGRQRLPMT